MRASLRRHITYANVTATLALVLSLTAGAYAAVQVTGKNVVNGSLTGKDIRPESIRGKHVRGLTLSDLRDGPGQYYLKNASGTGTGIAQATATCNGNDVVLSGGTRGAVGSYIEADGPDGVNPTTRIVTGWTGRVQSAAGNAPVQALVTAVCLVVPDE